MKIYLLDINPLMVQAWKQAFINTKDIEAVHSDLASFLDSHDVACVVSPGNAFGIMRVGYDYAITAYFGFALEARVQKRIKEDYGGEQTVGSALIVDIPMTDKKLIHTPTMRYPSRIQDTTVVYQCTKATLELALANHIESIVLPAFGGATGGLSPETVASMMKKAIDEIQG